MAYGWGDKKCNNWLENVEERSPNTSMNCVRILNFVLKELCCITETVATVNAAVVSLFVHNF